MRTVLKCNIYNNDEVIRLAQCRTCTVAAKKQTWFAKQLFDICILLCTLRGSNYPVIHYKFLKYFS